MSEIQILVGKNAKDNWNLLEDACEEDLWFHVQDESSAYVIIVNDFKNEITKEDINNAASICKQHSKLKNKQNVKINWLPVKHVKKGKTVGEAILLAKPNIIKI